jgi:hypothetical protein
MRLLKTKILTTALTLVLTLVSTAVITAPTPAEAANIKGNLCGGSNFNLGENQCQGSFNSDGQCVVPGEGVVDASRCGSESRLNRLITNIVNILSIIVGIVAVVMIIIGGFKYITSGGDSGSITSAKHTIIYAIVGLIIVALAQVIVRFVLSKAT